MLDRLDIDYNLGASPEDAPWMRVSMAGLKKDAEGLGLRLREYGPARRMLLRIVDSFDWRIARSGRVVVFVGADDDEELYLPAVARPRASAHSGSRVVESGPVEPASTDDVARLVREYPGQAALLGIRRALELGREEAIQRLYRLEDRNRKTQGIVRILEIGRDGPLRLGQTLPLRGFERSLERLVGGEEAAWALILDRVAASVGRRLLDYDGRPVISLEARMPAGEAYRLVAEALAAAMSANRPGVLADLDVEFLHDFRVALRRFRTAGAVLGTRPPADLDAALRSLWIESGHARDLDVFLSEAAAYRAGAAGAVVGEMDRLFARLETERRASYERLREHLAEDPGAKIRDHAAGLAPDGQAISVGDQAARVVEKRDRSFRKAVRRLLEKAGAGAPDAEVDILLHDARIKAKKARYVREVFAPVLESPDGGQGRRKGEAIRKTVKKLRRLQDALGAYNDLVSKEARMESLVAGREPAAAGYLLARIEGEKREAREDVMRLLGSDLVASLEDNR